jgi:hypothetical protein
VDPERGLCALRIGGWSPIDLVSQQALELVREQKEGERIAYVAATRARDLLVVPAVGDGPYEGGWVAPLNPAIYPDEHARRVQAPAAGCPTFRSRDTVLRRPDGDPASRATVCPGEHAFATPHERYTVVWWSPEPDALPLGAQASLGLRRDDLIVKNVPHDVLRRHLDTYDAWRSERASIVAAARVPSLQVKTVTEVASGGALSLRAPCQVSIETAAASGARPGGPRFGTLVHAALADVPLDDASDETIARIVDAHARVLRADAAETFAARDTVRRVLDHPTLMAAAAAAVRGECYREAPVTLRLDNGALIEGVVDLVFADGTGLVVVDFKTDRELEGALDRYRSQVEIYGSAVAEAMGRPVRAVLMRV